MNFRSDINGLRGWAVLLVVFYHFGIYGFQSGFIGVDIFLVISGYLMTGIILNKLLSLNDGFNIYEFYVSRIKRIVPVLIIVCFFVIFLGYFFLNADEYSDLSLRVVSALGFFSNFKFYNEADYFARASVGNFLLHTWSLSLEWQFYLLYPLLLILISKLSKKIMTFIFVLFIVSIISLAFSYYFSKNFPKAGFFLLPSRVWEFLCGGLIYIFSQKYQILIKKKIYFLWVGILIVILSIAFITNHSAWPGVTALLPVMGVMLIIFANQNNIILGNNLIQWLGERSYSIYLWHWPIFVVIVFFGFENILSFKIIGIIVSCLLGWVTFLLIESNMKKWSAKFGDGFLLFWILLSVLVLCFISFLIYKGNGFPARVSEAQIIFAESKNLHPDKKRCQKGPKYKPRECIYGDGDLGLIVTGDSHAASVVFAVAKSINTRGQSVLDWSIPTCPTIADVKRGNDKNCAKRINYFLNKINEIPDYIPLLIVNRYTAYVDGPSSYERSAGFEVPNTYVSAKNRYDELRRKEELSDKILETACKFSQRRKVYMLRPIPEMNNHVPDRMGRDFLLFHKINRISISIDEYNERHKKTLALQDKIAKECGIELIDPIPYLCFEGRCWGDLNGLPIYRDDDHLNERGANMLYPLFDRHFNDSVLK